MNIKKVCIGLALMLPMVVAPEAFAQSCGQSNNWQGSFNQNGFGQNAGYGQNGYGQGNWRHGKHRNKMQRKMQRRMWQQRQLSQNDPNYGYWNAHPNEYQSLWRSQAEMDSLLGGGIISPQEKAMLEAQFAAYGQPANLGNLGINGQIPYGQVPFGQDPYAYANYPATNNGILGNLLNGGNSNPYVNGAMPGLLQRLAGYWSQNQGLGF